MAERTEQHASARAGFKKIKVWIQTHPYEAGAIAFLFVLILVWYHFSKPSPAAAPAQSSTGNANTVAAQLQSEAINAQQTTALQAQQQAAAIAENNNQAMLAFGSIQAGETLGVAQILADIQGQQITTQGSVDLASIAANRDISFNNASAWSGVQLAGIQSNQAISFNNASTWLQGQSISATAAQNISFGNDAAAAYIARGAAVAINPIGNGGIQIGGGSATPNQLLAQGYTQQQIDAIIAGHF